MRKHLMCVISIGFLSSGNAAELRFSRVQRPHSPPCDSLAPPTAIFAPALADSGRIFRGAVGLDPREFYFFKKVATDPQAEDYRIFVTRLDGSTWSSPEHLRLGADYSDLYPALSTDGHRLVFTSYRPIPGDTSSHPSASLWYADRLGQGWDRPVPILAATEPGSYHSQPVFWGDHIVFRRTSPDWRTTQTLVTHWDGHAYQAPTIFTPVQQWVDWRGDIRVWGGIPGADGSFVILEISRLNPNTRQPMPSDLWVTVRTGQRWTEPRPLGAEVNTQARTENFPLASPDGCYLLFVRDFSTFYRVSLASALVADE